MSDGTICLWGESGTFCLMGQFVSLKTPLGQFVLGTKCLLTNSINETGRNPIFHLLFDGAPARFLRNHLKNYARRILDQSFDITINAIIFNEVPFYIVKRCNNQSLRRWFTLINIFKTTLYSLYYRRPLFDRNGSIIIRTFNHHLRAAKRAAIERNSDILEKIFFLPEKDDSVTPFHKILNEIHYDTALYRRKDNKDFCFLSDYRKRLSRTQNFQRRQNTSKISRQKKQLLIENAFKRSYNITNLSQTQGIDLGKGAENQNGNLRWHLP